MITTKNVTGHLHRHLELRDFTSVRHQTWYVGFSNESTGSPTVEHDSL